MGTFGCQSSGLIEVYGVIPHELLEYINMNTVTNVQKCAFLDPLLLTSAKQLDVNVEIEVQMARGRLHSPDSTFRIKGRTSALSLEPGRAQFEPKHEPVLPKQVTRDHAFNRKARCVGSTRLCPANLIRVHIVLKVGELRKRESESAKGLALFQFRPVLCKNWEVLTKKLGEVTEF